MTVCDLPNGERCYARGESAALFEAMQAREFVGEAIELEDGGKGINRIVA